MNLASVIACDKDVLLLDEPASMLDPVMAGRLLDRVKKINKEFLNSDYHRAQDGRTLLLCG